MSVELRPFGMEIPNPIRDACPLLLLETLPKLLKHHPAVVFPPVLKEWAADMRLASEKRF